MSKRFNFQAHLRSGSACELFNPSRASRSIYKNVQTVKEQRADEHSHFALFQFFFFLNINFFDI